MIGGIDIHIRTMAGDRSIEVAVRAVRLQWPNAVFENALTGERYESFWQIPFAEIEELFVYRDAALADAWDALGAVTSVLNTMIHILSDRSTLTIVIDERDGVMERIVMAIESAACDEVFRVPAELEAA
jgi:hypothetical protein